MPLTLNHEQAQTVAVEGSGLELWEDATGLAFECRIPDNEAGRCLVDALDRGEATGASFLMADTKDAFFYDSPEPELARRCREIQKVRSLADVAITIALISRPTKPLAIISSWNASARQARTYGLPATGARATVEHAALAPSVLRHKRDLLLELVSPYRDWKADLGRERDGLRSMAAGVERRAAEVRIDARADSAAESASVLRHVVKGFNKQARAGDQPELVIDF